MAHLHSVYDSDAHFSINPITRALKNEATSKTALIQYDHNSERFTFEIPRMIEGHDMSLCNVIRVHYINIDSKTKEQVTGVYEVEDMQISPESDDVVICSWLISQNATKLVGSLNFLLRFCCVTDDVVEYAWNTAIHTNISVSSGINADETFADDCVDVIERWKESVVQGFAFDLKRVADEMKADVSEWEKAESANVIAEMTAFSRDWNAVLDVERDRIDNLIAMRNTNGAVVVGGQCDKYDYTVTTNGATAQVEIDFGELELAPGFHAVFHDFPAEFAPMTAVIAGTDARLRIEPSEPGAKYSTISLGYYNDETQNVRVRFSCEYPLASVSVAELADIRVGADGTTYPTAGDAVRDMVGRVLTQQGEPDGDAFYPVGCLYMDTDTGYLYKCVANNEEVGESTWERVGISGGSGEQGEDGGYYLPIVTQDIPGSMEVAFTPSKDDMPEIPPVAINLPAGDGGDSAPEIYTGSKPPVNGEAIWINPDEEPEAGGGEVSPEAIKEAVDAYMAEHPVVVAETDPTVPAWAKQPNKPTYTAEEVGAMPADAMIPGGEKKTKIVTVLDMTAETDIVISTDDSDDTSFGDAVVLGRHYFYKTQDGEQLKAKRVFGYIYTPTAITLPSYLSAYYYDGDPTHWSTGDVLGNNVGILQLVSSNMSVAAGKYFVFGATSDFKMAYGGIAGNVKWADVSPLKIAYRSLEKLPIPHFSGIKMSGSCTFPVGTQFVIKAEVEEDA